MFKRSNRILYQAAFAVCALVAMWGIAYGSWNMINTERSKHWPTATAQIVSAEIRMISRGKGNYAWQYPPGD